ncbi:MAG TPA: hotdog fold thioesterase [Dehalococcoidia bacterium]|nr:hotdog fold thioesterase [Dehalococcoidia bacterium]
MVTGDLTDEYRRRGWGGLGATLGIEYEHVSAERVVMTMRVGPALHQPYGMLHGGASVALAESAASVGANVNCPPGKVALGQEINANHLRPMREGVLRAEAVPVHVGRTSQVWTIEMRDEAGRLVCVSRCTLAVIDGAG